MVARWAPTLTPAVVAELERKSKSDEDMTKDELEQWFAAVRLTEPLPPENVIIDEGDEWPPDPPSHVAWDRWYTTPVAKMLPPLATLRPRPSPRPTTRVGAVRPPRGPLGLWRLNRHPRRTLRADAKGGRP